MALMRLDMCVWHSTKNCICNGGILVNNLGINLKCTNDFLLKSPDYNHFKDGNYFKMEISSKDAGVFIGRSGKNIRHLRKKYCSKILVSNEDGKRQVYISQSPDKLKVIGQLMYKILNKKE